MLVNSTVPVCSRIKFCTHSIQKCSQGLLQESESSFANRAQTAPEYLTFSSVDIKLALKVFWAQLKSPVKCKHDRCVIQNGHKLYKYSRHGIREITIAKCRGANRVKLFVVVSLFSGHNKMVTTSIPSDCKI